jgi:hypothetical protein
MPDSALLIWIAANQDLLLLIWGSILAIAEVLKRVIPGTKDDTIIIKVLDMTGKIFTLGATSLLPKQAGAAKPIIVEIEPIVEAVEPPVE